MKRNIAILVQSLEVGGAEKQAVLLAEYLKDHHNVSFVIFQGDKVDKRFEDTLDQVASYRLAGNWFYKFLKLYAILKKKNVEILFSYLLFANIAGGLAGRLAGVKSLCGGVRSAHIPSKWKHCLQKLCHNVISTKTVFNNYQGHNSLIKTGFSRSKAIVIPNGFKVDDGFCPSRVPGRSVRILTVGRFHESKDHDTALKAVKHAAACSSTAIDYLLVGYGKREAEIRKRVRDWGMKEYVTIVRDPAELGSYYSGADIYLQTSRYEGLSNSIMEAMQAFLPIVATRAGDNKRLVIHGRNGYLVDVGDYRDGSARLTTLINDHARRITMGTRSFQHLQRYYSAPVFQERYLRLIASL